MATKQNVLEWIDFVGSFSALRMAVENAGTDGPNRTDVVKASAGYRRGTKAKLETVKRLAKMTLEELYLEHKRLAAAAQE